MTIHVRDNFGWDRRPDPADETIVVNRYSAKMLRVIHRANDIAERHGQHVVRVEHFIDAMFAEPEARARLSELGYGDADEDLRKYRFQLLSRRALTGSAMPSEARVYSDQLNLWLKAANEAAGRREPELHTVTIDDFVAALNVDQDLDDDLRGLQVVWARYRLDRASTLRAHLDGRFDRVERASKDARTDLGTGVQIVAGKVDQVSQQLASVDAHLVRVKQDTGTIRADTEILREVLPQEMRISGFLMVLVLLSAAIGGACLGLVARGQVGVL